jgi:uracil-DNA glycosylase
MPAVEHDRNRLQTALVALQTEIAGCDACVRAGFIPAAWPVFRGHAGMRLMVVGQAPGAASHEAGLPYSGATGRTLGRWLEQAGLPPGALYERFYLTSLTKCFPGKATGGGATSGGATSGTTAGGAGKGDRAPSAAEIRLCAGHLDRELALVRPAIILSLGRLAANALCPATRGLPLAEVVGRAWPGERAGHAFALVPLPHPSGVSHWLNDPANRARVDAALRVLAALVAAAPDQPRPLPLAPDQAGANRGHDIKPSS